MPTRNVLIASASSDIGAALALHFHGNGDRVVGTYRDRARIPAAIRDAGIELHACNVDSASEVATLAAELRRATFHWDIFISAVGVLQPIGRFVDLEFGEWERSVTTNSLSQLRLFHAIHGLRARSGISKVVFFAGGGTNGPFDDYSAYCLGKIALIKMCELIDSECEDVHVSILGTGWVRTKIHEQTLAAGQDIGGNYAKTRSFLESGAIGTSMEDIARCIEWCIGQPKSVTSGRNFSVVHDAWREGGNLSKALEADGNMYKLRRSGN